VKLQQQSLVEVKIKKKMNNHREFFEIVEESIDNYINSYIKEKELTVSACLAPLALA
jgi:hypothetical protein